MDKDQAECAKLPELLPILAGYLEQYQRFEHADAMKNAEQWQQFLQTPLPEHGVGIKQLLAELGHQLLPHASQIPNPACTSFITTGATTAGVLANLAASVASPQRSGLTAFSYLEELSLEWMAQLFHLHPDMKGVYSSGGSVANLVALGGARQWAFEQMGLDPARDGVTARCRLYASAATHNTVQRAAAVLGMGRRAVCTVKSDSLGRMIPQALARQLTEDKADGSCLGVAVIANAGTTSTGAIDPIGELAGLAAENKIWFHVDGAYGLPGILDPRITELYQGIQEADSVIVDPHKWLGAPVGIGATYVRDRSILSRAFTQEASDYLEGSLADTTAQHSLDSLGIPYYDFGVELSAPSRGVVVWALLREIGKDGLKARICRHNDIAKRVAQAAHQHPKLEVVQEPTLSICCFRYISDRCKDLNQLNRDIHRHMIHRNLSMPSTAMVNGKLAIRPCFLGAATTWQHAQQMLDEVLSLGEELEADYC